MVNVVSLFMNCYCKQVRNMVIPDIWIEAGSQKEQYEIARIDLTHIISKVESTVDSIRSYRPKRVMDVKAENYQYPNQ